MLDRLSLQSDMARFHLFSGTNTDVFSDSRLAERRVQSEPLLSEADLPKSKSVDGGESLDREEEVDANAEVDTNPNADADANANTMPLGEESKQEATVAGESVELDEEEMMRLLDESVKEAVASPRLSPEPSAALSKPSPAEPVSQSDIPTNPAVSPAQTVAKEYSFSANPAVPMKNAVSQPADVASSPIATPKPSVVSPAEESVSSSVNTPVNPVPVTPSANSFVAAPEPPAASVEPLPSSVRNPLQHADSNSLEFPDLTASMIDSIPLAPVVSSSFLEQSIMGHSIMEGSIYQPSFGQNPVNQNPVNLPSVDQLPVNQSPIDQNPVNQLSVNQSPVNQLSINLPSVDQPPVNQPPVTTGDIRPISRRRRKTYQPAIAVETEVASARASAESISEPTQPVFTQPNPTQTEPIQPKLIQPEPIQPEPTHIEPTQPSRPSQPDSDISIEPSELLKAVDVIQPTPAEIPPVSIPSSRPSALSSLSTDSVNESALEKAMEVAMETVDSAPHLLKSAETPLVSSLRRSGQQAEIRHVSIGITPTPIPLIHRSSSTRTSEQPPIQPSRSTAIKRVSARRVSLQPPPPLPREVPPPPPPGAPRRGRPSLVRPSREAASSRNSSERRLPGRPSQPL